MFNEQTREFETIQIATPEEKAEIAPSVHLFEEGQMLELWGQDAIAYDARLHAITRKDLVIKNRPWLVVGSTFQTKSTKKSKDEEGKEESVYMTLRVRKRSGSKTYLRPVVENKITIKKGKSPC